jgi:hypothetical protein
MLVSLPRAALRITERDRAMPGQRKIDHEM